VLLEFEKIETPALAEEIVSQCLRYS
jgi:hypothetical protein